MLRNILLILCVFIVGLTPLNAQVSVRVDKAAKLFAQPSEKSIILSEVGGKSNFRALEQSTDRKWVFISDGLRYGWIRKVFVKPIDEASAAVGGMGAAVPTRESVVAENKGSDEDLPDDIEDDAPASTQKEEDTFEDESDFEEKGPEKYLIKQPGSFYEKPKRNAPKFGVLEPNDQVEVLSYSQDQKWVQLRLIETGEEGWIPRSRMGRKVESSELSQLENPSNKLNHIGISGTLAPEPWNFGFLAFIRRGFRSLTIGETPLEIGLGLGFNSGTSERYFSKDVNVSYLDARLFAHYEPLLSSRWGLPIELGLIYKYGAIETELTPSQFEAIDSRILESEVGAFVGVGLTYFVFDSLRLEFLPQIQLTSAVDMTFAAGAIFSF